MAKSHSPCRHAGCALLTPLTVTPPALVALALQEQILHSMFHSLQAIAMNPLWHSLPTVLLNQVLIGVCI